jgi:hypothetical protein
MSNKKDDKKSFWSSAIELREVHTSSPSSKCVGHADRPGYSEFTKQNHVTGGGRANRGPRVCFQNFVVWGRSAVQFEQK